LTPRQQHAAAKLIVIGTMLRGHWIRTGGQQVLLSPARMRVQRYVKGAGPRTVQIQTGVRLVHRQIQFEEDGILPSSGQRWEIFSSSRNTPLQTSVCLGSRRLRGA
jgi:hypothetical protein